LLLLPVKSNQNPFDLLKELFSFAGKRQRKKNPGQPRPLICVQKWIGVVASAGSSAKDQK
jgi:hypothetical protein